MKTILITGSSRGIGKATAQLAHKQGYRVIVHGKTDSPQLQALHQALDGSIKTFFDIADGAATRAAVAKVLEEVGTIDVLVNNAGAGKSGFKDIADVDDEQALREYKINVLGAIHCVQAVLPKMLQKEGCSVVTIGSIKGQPNLIGMSSLPYGLAKASVIALSKALAKAYPSVRFNSVSPGYIQTDMSKEWDPSTFERINSGTLAARIGQPEEIASLVMFLASDGAGYITGQDYLADGGYSIQGK